MLKIAGSDREQLGFPQAVQKAFAFLEDDGLRPVEIAPTLVRYESARSFVNVFHGRASYEIGVELGCKAKEQRASSYPRVGGSSPVIGTEYDPAAVRLVDILAFLGVSGFTSTQFFQASTPHAVCEVVARCAELLAKHGRIALDCDAAFWYAIKEWRSDEAKREQNRGELRRARDASRRAWEERAYQQVVDLLVPYYHMLTASERKKLEYAKRRLPDKHETED